MFGIERTKLGRCVKLVLLAMFPSSRLKNTLKIYLFNKNECIVTWTFFMVSSIHSLYSIGHFSPDFFSVTYRISHNITEVRRIGIHIGCCIESLGFVHAIRNDILSKLLTISAVTPVQPKMIILSKIVILNSN